MVADKKRKHTSFRGWQFPKDPGYIEQPPGIPIKGTFVGTEFATPTDFGEATFGSRVSFRSAIFSDLATFYKTTFPGKVDFHMATFNEDVRFEFAEFRRNADLSRTAFHKQAYFHAVRFGGEVMFKEATFNGDAWFDEATFSKYAGFYGVTFSGFVLFAGATFKNNGEFSLGTFRSPALFNTVTFGGDASFDGATFSKDAVFDGAHCAAGATVFFDESCRVRGLKEALAMNPTGSAKGAVRWAWKWLASYVVGHPHPFRLRRAGEEAYRLAKQSAQAVGNHTEAGLYHFAEQWAIEDRYRRECRLRPWRKSFGRWLGRLIFGRMIFGYGEKPERPLLVGLAVIAVCAVLYFAGGAVGCGEGAAAVAAYKPSVWDSIHFSVVTFTTLGYGDFVPKPHWRWLADTEAVLGAALLATFVVCLTRKFLR